jgi:uncharacterized protein (DUF2147 family)
MRRLAIVLVVFSLVHPSAVLGAASPPTGRWITESGNLEVVVAPCGAELCGTVARVLANHSMSSPGTEMGERPGVGLIILKDFAPSGDDAWEGLIYNRENGKTYSCVMRVRDAEQLEIRPYIGIHLIGKTQIWRRAPEPAVPAS